MMRIITGSARGTHLVAPQGLETRPTSERAKMGIYNILQFDITGRRVLDLFAGSGQMGLEALSRGASEAVFADFGDEALRAVRANIQRTHMEARCRVVQGDYKKVLREMEGKAPFDLIFLDPPYKSGYLDSALILLKKYRLIGKGCYLVCETGGRVPEIPYGLAVLKTASWGKNHVTILKPEEEEA